MAELIIGVDVGGTNTRLGLVEMTGRRAGNLLVIPTEVEGGAEQAVSRIASSVKSLLDAAQREHDAVGIGLACPGPLDQECGVLLNPPNLKGWENFPIVRAVVEATGIDNVCLENDANAAALGEYWRGSGKGTKCVLMLTLGTGIGGGIVLDGRLWAGPGGIGGELGHLTIDRDGPKCGCGNHGCLEALASAAAIERRAREAAASAKDSLLATAAEPLTPKVVHELALKGDKTARAILEETARFIGIAVAGLVNIFNPDVVVLGGGISAAFDIIEPVINDEIKRRSFGKAAERVKVLRSALGDAAGVVGAAAVLLQREGGLPRPWHIERIIDPVLVRALHIGRTGTDAAIVEIKGDVPKVICRVRRGPQAGTRESMVGMAVEAAQEALAISHVPQDHIWGTGISTPGPLDPHRRKVLNVPGMGWANTDLGEEFKIFDSALFVENDADAAALAELKFGKGRGVDDFLVLYLGSGVGAGIVIGGEIYRGFRGTAGEIGHQTINYSGDAPWCACGNRGCLELYGGGTKLVRDVSAAVKVGSPTAVGMKVLSEQLNYLDVWEAAQKGDELCKRLLELMGRMPGVGVANYLNLLNPKKVIVAGPLARAWNYFGERLVAEVHQRAFYEARRDVPIEPTDFGEDSDLIAAGAAFAEQWRPGGG